MKASIQKAQLNLKRKHVLALSLLMTIFVAQSVVIYFLTEYNQKKIEFIGSIKQLRTHSQKLKFLANRYIFSPGFDHRKSIKMSAESLLLELKSISDEYTNISFYQESDDQHIQIQKLLSDFQEIIQAVINSKPDQLNENHPLMKKFNQYLAEHHELEVLDPIIDELTADIRANKNLLTLFQGIFLTVMIVLLWLIWLYIIKPSERQIEEYFTSRNRELIEREKAAALEEANRELQASRTAILNILMDNEEARVRAEQAQARINAVVEAAPNGMLMVNKKGNITLVNQQMEHMFGYTRDELIGSPIEILVPERFRNNHPANRDVFHKSPSARGMGTDRELFAVKKNGEEFPVEIGLNPIITSDGYNVLASVIDITERVESQITLQRTIKELEQFAYVASHDLKSPLRAIENLATWIKQDCENILPEKSLEDLHLLIDRVARMKNLQESLLTYSRIGRTQQAHEEFNCRDLIEEIIHLQHIPDNFQIIINGEFPKLSAPKAALSRVIGNLLNNAIKHHDKDKGIVEITGKIINNYFQLTIKDDGPGIAPKFHQQIFEMFQTLKPRDEVEGSGMGLATVRKTLEYHNGEISLNSEVGQGTIFTVRWPLDLKHNTLRSKHAWNVKSVV